MPFRIEEFQPVAHGGRVSGQDRIGNPPARLVVLVLCIQELAAKTHGQVIRCRPSEIKIDPSHAGICRIFSGNGTRTLGRAGDLQARIVVEENRTGQAQIAGQVCFVTQLNHIELFGIQYRTTLARRGVIPTAFKTGGVGRVSDTAACEVVSERHLGIKRTPLLSILIRQECRGQS